MEVKKVKFDSIEDLFNSFGDLFGNDYDLDADKIKAKFGNDFDEDSKYVKPKLFTAKAARRKYDNAQQIQTFNELISKLNNRIIATCDSKDSLYVAFEGAYKPLKDNIKLLNRVADALAQVGYKVKYSNTDNSAPTGFLIAW